MDGKKEWLQVTPGFWVIYKLRKVWHTVQKMWEHTNVHKIISNSTQTCPQDINASTDLKTANGEGQEST